eukprot:1543096-Amphidinium_carterae.1
MHPRTERERSRERRVDEFEGDMPRRRMSSKSNPCREFGHKPYPIPATQVLVSERARAIMEVETDDNADMCLRDKVDGPISKLTSSGPNSHM